MCCTSSVTILQSSKWTTSSRIKLFKNTSTILREKKHVLLLHKNDNFKNNAIEMLFIRDKNLIYYIDKLTNVRYLCIFKDYVKEISDIAHDSDHLGYVRMHDIITKSWYIHDLIKILRKYIQHCSECLTCQLKKHKLYEFFQFINFSFVSFHTIIMNFVLILSHIELEDKFTKTKIITSLNTMLTVTNKFSKEYFWCLNNQSFSRTTEQIY